MFIKQGPLDSLISSTVRRYGLKTSGSTDPEILLMINDAMETWYSKIIRELIEISRS